MSPLKRVVAKAWSLGRSWNHQRYVEVLKEQHDIHPSFDIRLDARLTGEGRFRLGANSYVNNNTRLRVSAGHTLTIGEGCRIAENCRIETSTGNPDHDLSRGSSPKIAGDVTIGDFVWIGAGSYIAPGVTIGDGAVVGANSVVKRPVEPNEIVGGTPLRHIRYKVGASQLPESR